MFKCVLYNYVIVKYDYNYIVQLIKNDIKFLLNTVSITIRVQRDLCCL